MKLYHVTFDKTEPLYKHFIPRVPAWTLEGKSCGEDNKTPRICFSSSVNLAMQAINGEDYLSKGCRFIVYEFDVNPEDPNLVYPQELFDKGLVKDALENQEFWYLDELYLYGIVCVVTDFYIYGDYAWTCIPNHDFEDIVRSLYEKANDECRVLLHDILDNRDFEDKAEIYYELEDILSRYDYRLAMDLECEIHEIPWSIISRVENVSYHSLMAISA